MDNSIAYAYASPSAITTDSLQNELFLAQYSEIEKRDSPCFFWGSCDITEAVTPTLEQLELNTFMCLYYLSECLNWHFYHP